jgi:arginase
MTDDTRLTGEPVSRGPAPTDRQVVVIEAPSGLGLETRGVEGLSRRLLDMGLADAIGVQDIIRLEPSVGTNAIDPRTGVLNAAELAGYSRDLANAVEAVLARGEFPLILGGDCSILLGSALALKRRGRHGLLFIDGNADFFQPEANPNGEAASMDLAFATGHGPKPLVDLEGRGPSLLEADVVAFGWRDHEDQAEYGSQPLPEAMGSFDLPTIREMGFEAAAEAAIARLAGASTGGVFIHLDVDVLDDAIMPAVDYRIPDGLTAEELERLLRLALASGRVIGLEVAIYNPRLDEDGAAGELLTEMLIRVLERR